MTRNRQETDLVAAPGAKLGSLPCVWPARVFSLGALVIACLALSCASPKQMAEGSAVKIAKEAVLKELGWKKVLAESYPAPDGGCSVTVWLVPEAPGRFFVVDVSADGRVTAMHPGN